MSSYLFSLKFFFLMNQFVKYAAVVCTWIYEFMNMYFLCSLLIFRPNAVDMAKRITEVSHPSINLTSSLLYNLSGLLYGLFTLQIPLIVTHLPLLILTIIYCHYRSVPFNKTIYIGRTSRIVLICFICICIPIFFFNSKITPTIFGTFFIFSFLSILYLPLLHTGEIIHYKTTVDVSLPQSISLLFSCIFWSIYGYSNSDLFILFSYSVGICLLVVQLVLIAIYPSRRRESITLLLEQ